MQDIAPPLILLWDIKRALEKSYSISYGMNFYLKRKKIDVFQYQIETWWALVHGIHNQNIKFDREELTLARRHLIDIIEMGLRGESILLNLKEIETELILSCEDEIQKYVSLLPIKMMLPLMFLIFPALMLLLVVPLLQLLQF